MGMVLRPWSVAEPTKRLGSTMDNGLRMKVLGPWHCACQAVRFATRPVGQAGLVRWSGSEDWSRRHGEFV